MLGLNVRPSMATVLARTVPPQAWTILRAMVRFRWSFTATVVSISRSGAPLSCAVLTRASVSFGKQEPPYPGPACRNFEPMRLSSPMPRATSCTFAPTFSQRSAISLMNVILSARKGVGGVLYQL